MAHGFPLWALGSDFCVILPFSWKLACICWRRQWQPTPVLLPGKSHGWRSLVGCSPWGHWGSDTTERLHFHFSLSCTGEGNGNPLQCSCLENPRDGGAWWAAVYGVTQSWTRLKRLSSSSSSRTIKVHTSGKVTLPRLILNWCKALNPSVSSPISQKHGNARYEQYWIHSWRNKFPS